MKKLLLFTLLLGLCALPVRAEETNSVRETRLENRQELREQIQENRTEIKDQRLENRQEVRSVVAENHANRLERRFNYYYKRLSGIATRLQTRLNTMSSEGKDVSAAQSKLLDAKNKLESAKTSGAQAVSAFRALDPATFAEQKAEALAARDLANQARTAFKETLALLKVVLKEVK